MLRHSEYRRFRMIVHVRVERIGRTADIAERQGGHVQIAESGCKRHEMGRSQIPEFRIKISKLYNDDLERKRVQMNVFELAYGSERVASVEQCNAYSACLHQHYPATFGKCLFIGKIHDFDFRRERLAEYIVFPAAEGQGQFRAFANPLFSGSLMRHKKNCSISAAVFFFLCHTRYYSRIAAIPGSSLPSRYSSMAPPPVET